MALTPNGDISPVDHLSCACLEPYPPPCPCNFIDWTGGASNIASAGNGTAHIQPYATGATDDDWFTMQTGVSGGSISKDKDYVVLATIYESGSGETWGMNSKNGDRSSGLAFWMVPSDDNLPNNKTLWAGSGGFDFAGIATTAKIFSGKITSFGEIGDPDFESNQYTPDSFQMTSSQIYFVEPNEFNGYQDMKVLHVDRVSIVEDVAIGNSATGPTTAGTTTTISSFSHTGSVILVAVAFAGGVDDASTSVTYGSQSLSLQRSDTSAVDNIYLEIWKIVNPTANNAAITVTGPTSRARAMFAIEIKQGELLKRGASASGSSTSTSVALGGQPELNRVVVALTAMLKGTTSTTMSLTSGTGYAGPTDVGSGSTKVTAALAVKAVTGSTDTISYTLSQSREWGAIMVEVSSGSLE